MTINSNNKNILLISNTNLSEGTPLGIGYLHAYLENNNFYVESIFLDNTPTADHYLKDTIKKLQPSIVGIQIITATRMQAFKTIERIHNEYPHIMIVIGGIHATTMYKQILKKYPFVIAVLGEGEDTFLELAQCIINNSTLDTIKGIAFINKNIIVRTPERSLIENLDKLPFPKHSLFLSREQSSAMILTSRGCPFNCSFCCLSHINKYRVRFRSIPNVITELKYIKNNFPQVEQIWIADDTFLIDNARVIALCNAIMEESFKFKFLCAGRFVPISEEMVQILEAAGFFNIGLGLESGNDNIRNNAHKNISKEDIIKAVTIFSKSKITIQIFLIIGLPGETYHTIKETALFVQKLQQIKYIYYWNDLCSIATVYPYTELYLQMKNANLLTDNIWLTDTPDILYTLEHDSKTLLHMRKILHTYLSLDYFLTFSGFLKQWHIVFTSLDKYNILVFVFKRTMPKFVKLIKYCLPYGFVCWCKKQKAFRGSVPAQSDNIG